MFVLPITEQFTFYILAISTDHGQQFNIIFFYN